MRIILMHETIAAHDAVGNDIEAMFNILKEKHEVYAYAVTCKNGNLQYATTEMMEEIISSPENVIIYHHSVNWDLGHDILRRARCRIIFKYHNITPSSFFRPYSKPHYDVCNLGASMTAELVREFPDAFWMTDSDYNARDLRGVPDNKLMTVPPFNKLEQWGSAIPDPAVGEELKSFDGINVLFVGRIVPNKGYLMLIDIIHQYVTNYDRHIKLRIIGKAEEVMAPYTRLVDERIREYGLEDNISFIGEVTDETLVAYYKYSDVMLCCSAHEGFCVPVTEAQYFGLPVIALRYCAVPETIGENQLLLGTDEIEFAAAIRLISENSEYRDFLVYNGYENYKSRFTYAKIRERFEETFRRSADGEPGCGKSFSHARIAFVAPWFGERVPGGAEMELRSVAGHLHEAGMDVEILTTQVENFASDWSVNYYPEGVEYIRGIPVVRFPVRNRDRAAFDRVNLKFMKGKKVSYEEEEIFCREMVNSPALYKYIADNRDYYDLFVFIPYMFGTTYYGMQQCPGKAVLIPCFHDEGYAYMEHFREVFSRAAGMVYNAEPERELAGRLYDMSNVAEVTMGIGMDTSIESDGERFREKFGIHDPFLLYAGRKDAGKGVDELISYYCTLRKKLDKPLKLVLIGGGTVEIPRGFEKDIIDLGFVDISDKYDACGAALCLCQLSKHESFSFVIMESWLCGRPVIVHRECEVTADFAKRFGGGYAIGNYEEFADAVMKYMTDEEGAAAMGRSGCKNVKANFDWEIIIKRYQEFFGGLIGDTDTSLPQN